MISKITNTQRLHMVAIVAIVYILTYNIGIAVGAGTVYGIRVAR